MERDVHTYFYIIRETSFFVDTWWRLGPVL